jgi:hypothetical protein
VIFHGQGLPSDFEEKQLRRYLEQVHRALSPYPDYASAPVVVAAAFRDLLRNPRTSDDVDTIRSAAREVRVDVFFVDRDENPSAHLDLAVAQTLSKDRRVHSVARSGLPPEGPVAAIFRY